MAQQNRLKYWEMWITVVSIVVGVYSIVHGSAENHTATSTTTTIVNYMVMPTPANNRWYVVGDDCRLLALARGEQPD